MTLRMADMNDLPQIKLMYSDIVNHMSNSNLQIWDDVYPCEFLGNDIEHNRLYVLLENSVIVSAFALCTSHAGADSVNWQNKRAKALYIDRLGVNINYLRKGIGGAALKSAISLAKEMNAEYLRLFVVDINQPAINLYLNHGFKKASGFYDEIIDDELTLRELGFEIKTSI